MHRETRDRLEELLRAPDAHVNACAECGPEVNSMREHRDWMQQLRAPQDAGGEDLEPTPGFYARVLQRIEECAKRSIWYGMVYSPVGKRLAYASLSLALVLGLYVIAAEQSDRPAPGRPAVVEPVNAQVFGASGTAEQRDAVLVNFASYGSSGDSAALGQP